MVAKATQNLFDVNIGGAGFHVTSHLIALAALFIACFAIAGYVSFRDNSVPASALKEQSDSLTKQGETWTFEKEFELTTLVQDGGTDVIGKTGLVLPSDAVIVNATMLTQVASVGALPVGADLILDLGTRNLAVGAPSTGTPLTDAYDAAGDNNTNDLLFRGSGVDTVLVKTDRAISAEQEVYFATSSVAFTAQGTTTPRVIVTVQWTGSAPVAY